MAASTARRAAPSVVQEGLSAWNARAETVSIAQKLIQRHEKVVKDLDEAVAAERAQKAVQYKREVVKSFPFHLGANINVPTSEARYQPEAEIMPVEAPKKDNPFAGLPLQAWAERLGERIMPAYELIKEEQKKAKLAAKPAVQSPPTVSVPHLLPITRWAASSASIRDTLIAEDPKTRKKARMSWYHPDDTMVPRDWFKGGLLADLKYYSPFRKAQASD